MLHTAFRNPTQLFSFRWAAPNAPAFYYSYSFSHSYCLSAMLEGLVPQEPGNVVETADVAPGSEC